MSLASGRRNRYRRGARYLWTARTVGFEDVLNILLRSQRLYMLEGHTFFVSYGLLDDRLRPRFWPKMGLIMLEHRQYP